VAVKGAELQAWVARYYHNPELFVREMWAVKPYAWQCEVLAEIAKGTRRIAVPTGHGVGKTALVAWGSIWFLLTRYPCKVVQTAPSSATLDDGLFAETAMWINRLPDTIKGLLEVKADSIELRSDPKTAFLTARTSRAEKPEALAGIHSDNMLFACDEASGIPDEVFSAGQGSMSAVTAITMLTGNPTRATGYFADAISSGKDVIWWVREVSCLEVLNEHPNAPSEEFVEEMKLLYGESSNTYRFRVLGKLPLSDDEVIIPLELVQQAMRRDVIPSATAPMYWGLDVARLGKNESALAKRRGHVMPEPVRLFRELDTMQLCGQIAAMYQGTALKDRPAEILVDGIGLGAGVVDRLRELGLPAVGINVSERKSLSNAYYNLKAELWYTGRAWFASLMVRIEVDREDHFIKGLTTVKPENHSTGLLIVEPKEKTLRRIGKKEERRLDAADSFILTFAGQAVAAAYGSDRHVNWNQPVTRGRKMIA